ncbi:MAG: DNA helicase [Anaerolinea sp.]|nr:DNA helicase [Anaerolinea sp.]
MVKQQSLIQIQIDLQSGNLGKARDRLHGLIQTYPDDLELRSRLAEIYLQLQLPEMAGRYWYLNENKNERMTQACSIFEERFNHDPLQMLFAIKFKGDVAGIAESFAGKTLLELHQQAKEKYQWYEDFRRKGKLKFTQSQPGKDTPTQKFWGKIVKWVLIGLLVSIPIFCVIGVISVIKSLV